MFAREEGGVDSDTSEWLAPFFQCPGVPVRFLVAAFNSLARVAVSWTHGRGSEKRFFCVFRSIWRFL